MERRALLTTGALGTMVGAVARSAAAQPDDQAARLRTLDQVRDALVALQTDLRNEREFLDIAVVRTAQKTFLRANGKLPDVLELGAEHWFTVYDWHVRWHHPIVEGRDASGRLTLSMLGTSIVLRPDVPPTYVGLPYDAR